jgi:hypothetical protein
VVALLTERDVEILLEELGHDYEILGPGLWNVDASEESGVGNLILNLTPPLLLLRANVAPLPKKENAGLYKLLLETNARDMVHGSFGIDGDEIVIVESLEASYVSSEELQASIDSFGFALSTVEPRLKEFGVK